MHNPIVTPQEPHALYQEHRYSAALRAGDLLFVSGQVGVHKDGQPEKAFEAQVRLAFQNLQDVLAAAGGSLQDVVDITTFHTQPEQQFAEVMKVRDEFFPSAPFPNWTAVGVNWLAGFDFEIKAIARIPK